MSPRDRGQHIRWWVIGPALGLWLAAVIALSAFATPTTARDATDQAPVATAVATHDSNEAPIMTLTLVAVGVAAVVLRPARRAVARRRADDPGRTR
ncbi:MAG TPA: hypothetical protein VFQ81_01500 [Candidatus Limnocylindria bacterium]|nr:hypothetical protein [Candidatus Limnocylindria bacterium]